MQRSYWHPVNYCQSLVRLKVDFPGLSKWTFHGLDPLSSTPHQLDATLPLA